MQLAVSGVLTDFRGRVLLRQTGPKSLAPVGRALEPGVLPGVTLARAFREETGLIVLPVRLTGLYFDGGAAGGELTFCFRCTMRGGDLTTPADGPASGFFDVPLPPGLSSRDRARVEDALRHDGGPVLMRVERGGAAARLGRLLGRREAHEPPEAWDVTVRVVGAADQEVEWFVATPEDAPAGHVAAATHRPPWETAARLLDPITREHGAVVRPARVEVAPDRPALTLVFAPVNPSSVGR